MKKILIFGLAVLLIATMLISCEKEPTYNVQSDDPIESHDNESTANPNDSTDDNSISETTQSEKFFADQKVFKIEIDTGTFLVKQTKHTYRDSDLILLYIENQSSKDYSLTISGKYLDQSGEIIKSEEQTFDQYYSGYKNYFLFYPDAYFSDFEFTLSFGEVKKLSNDDPRSSDKDIRVTDFEYKFLGLEEGKDVIPKLLFENEDFTRYPSIIAYLTCSNHTSFARVPYLEIILYNSNGEIISIFSRAPYLGLEQPFGNGEPFPIYQTTKESLVWPEKYLGEISAIVCVLSIDTYPALQQHAPARFTQEGLATEYEYTD